MVPDRIEREIVIDAPVEIVWAVVTEPEQISGWFSDSVELDLRKGGEATFVWDEHGTVRGRVERVEPPHLFAFRWVPTHSVELALNKRRGTILGAVAAIAAAFLIRNAYNGIGCRTRDER